MRGNRALCIGWGVMLWASAVGSAAAQAPAPPPTATAPATAPAMTIEQMLEEADQALKAGRPDIAGQYHSAVLAQDPGNRDALVGICEVYRQSGQRVLAMEQYQAYTEENPNDWRGWYGLGLVQIDSEWYRQATLSLKRADELRPNDPQILIAWARALAGLSEHVEALKKGNAAVSADANDPEIRRQLAIIQLRARIAGDTPESVKARLTEAATHATAAVNLVRNRFLSDPTNTGLLNGLLANQRLLGGIVSAQIQMDPESGALYHRAAALTADIAATQRLASYHEALAYARQACQLEPQQPDCWLLVGGLATQIGLRDEAIAAFKKIRELDPGNEAAKEGLKRLGVTP